MIHFVLANVANMKWLVELNPSLVDFLMLAISKLRWDEQNIMPHTQVKSQEPLFLLLILCKHAVGI